MVLQNVWAVWLYAVMMKMYDSVPVLCDDAVQLCFVAKQRMTIQWQTLKKLQYGGLLVSKDKNMNYVHTITIVCT